MLLYRQRKKIADNFFYLKVLIKAYFIPVGKKVIYIDLSLIQINRYLAALLRMLSIEGYTIFVPANKKVMKTLKHSKGDFRYFAMLFRDNLIKFKDPPQKLDGQISIPATRLSNNYFSSSSSVNSYHIPMCCYPAFYEHYYLFDKLGNFNKNRKRSIFMAGNFDSDYYNRIDHSPFFNQPSRNKILEFLKEKKYYQSIKTISQLDDYIREENDNNLILINTKEDFRIPFTSLFDYLSRFEFFLALPGITIPQSHNLIEAMACGCIPIIHTEYAALMKPPLEDGVNAFLFSNLDELHKLILKTFKIPDDHQKEVYKNVKIYYSSFLTPEAVVNKVINPELENIYIQAEHYSLKW